MDLYSKDILQLSKAPRLEGKLESAQHAMRAINAFCGDKFTVWMNGNGTVTEALFEGYGCAVSKASSAILTECIVGKSWTEIAEMTETVLSFLADESVDISHIDPRLVDFGIVKKYPGRFDCAALPWREMAKFAVERASDWHETQKDLI